MPDWIDFERERLFVEADKREAQKLAERVANENRLIAKYGHINDDISDHDTSDKTTPNLTSTIIIFSALLTIAVLGATIM